MEGPGDLSPGSSLCNKCPCFSLSTLQVLLVPLTMLIHMNVFHLFFGPFTLASHCLRGH